MHCAIRATQVGSYRRNPILIIVRIVWIIESVHSETNPIQQPMLQELYLPDTHLDLGCGIEPHNPYLRGSLYGIDIRPYHGNNNIIHVVANLALEPIPFPDNFFGSVSAFDFLEHIPRILTTQDNRTTVFPFVQVMNEISRVLAPGGRLYAVTPCFPSQAAFQDPTHVNFISVLTHEYFCGSKPQGAMYGFNGHFRELRTGWVVLKDSTIADQRKFSHRFRWLRRKLKGKLTHYLWEFEVIK